MVYSENEILQYIEENDLKFVKLTFCDLSGKLKNISILSSELAQVFENGIRISPNKIFGFNVAGGKDLFLFPDLQTMTILPWRPQQGRVMRMFCYIRYADGSDFEGDGRCFLKKAVKVAINKGYCFRFSTSCEFTLFKKDSMGFPTKVPHDLASYCDIAPDDKGENIRRDVCLALEEMGIHPISSRHESGHGQHEIDFNASTALKAADTFLSFKSAVKSIAEIHDVHASFMPKPISNDYGNGMSISFNIFSQKDLLEENKYAENSILKNAAAGIMKYIREFTLFTNSTVNSYERLGSFFAPIEIVWAKDEGSQLIRMDDENSVFPVELRSADCVCNPYFEFGLMIYASLCGIEENLQLPEENAVCGKLPTTLKEACECANNSKFVKKYIPDNILKILIEKNENEWQKYSDSNDKQTFEEYKYFCSL